MYTDLPETTGKKKVAHVNTLNLVGSDDDIA